MNWFLIALGAPFLWALVNISDQYLVAKYAIGERGSGGLVLFSSLIGILIAIGIYVFIPSVIGIPFWDKILLLITGVLTIIWVIFYLFALEIEDVSRVVAWFLTIPIFGYILGYIFLGETLSIQQKIGSIITLLGVILISIDFTNINKTRFKLRPALYMIVGCVLLAVVGVIFKYITVEDNFWVSSFWQYAGLGGAGILIYMFSPKYRKEFKHMNRNGGKKIIVLNVVSELGSIGGNLLTNFALLLAPVTMIYLVGTFQPAILCILTILCTYFFPRIIKEDMSRRALLPKIASILIMIIGSVILFQ